MPTLTYPDPVQNRIRKCTRCALHKVYGGPVPISLAEPGFLIIGEAPGAVEDEKGKPFTGPAGMFLRPHLKQCGIPPGRTSFANVVSCRPHDNRDPSSYELQRCRGNLLAQIAVAQPRVIIPVGKFGLQALYPHGTLKNDVGRVLFYGKMDGHSVWILPTWHPAYIMRPNGRANEATWHKHLRLAASLISKPPNVSVFPETCRVCRGKVEVFDVMGGAWCRVHYKEVPRTIWQDEMPGMGETYDMNNSTGKGKKKVEQRAREQGLL